MRIVMNKDASALALQVRGTDDVRVLQEDDRQDLVGLGFPIEAVDQATYLRWRARAGAPH